MNELIDIGTSIFKPLILMVEDRKETREDQILEFETRGCAVISASNADDALKFYMGLPKLDLIFSDIDLVGEKTKYDKSGVDIAKFVKQLDNDIPIIGYSSKFKDDDLTSDEKSYFDRWYDKGGMNISELDKMFDEIHDEASKQKQRRFEEFREVFKDLVRKEQLKQEDLKDALDIASAIGTNPLSMLDEDLINSHISLLVLRQVDQEVLKKPVLVWLSASENLFEVEVYGHSDIYSYGDSEDSAVNNLIQIMRGYYEDFKTEQESSFAGPALKMRRFLKYLFD